MLNWSGIFKEWIGIDKIELSFSEKIGDRGKVGSHLLTEYLENTIALCYDVYISNLYRL